MPWGLKEKRDWFQKQRVHRSYQDEVVSQVRSLATQFDVTSYGSLHLDPDRYPLYVLTSRNFDGSKPSVLITGGVHGYETSGVHGALSFLAQRALAFPSFNFICAPCISPWSYETINRWNADAVDPNRSFFSGTSVGECRLLLECLQKSQAEIFVHFDLHETTNTDNTVFRPALGLRDGVPQELWEIPDGFYLVGDVARPQPNFQKAVIDSVRKVTHIAPPDNEGRLIGVPLQQDGVIHYDVQRLFLCAGITAADFVTTTEVYPDSPKLTPELCIAAQVAAIEGGLRYVERLRT